MHKPKHKHSHLFLLWNWHYTILLTSESITLPKHLSTKTKNDLSNHRLCVWSDLCPGWNARLEIHVSVVLYEINKDMKQTSRKSLLIHRIWTTCPACILLHHIHTHMHVMAVSIYTTTTKMEKQQTITWKKNAISNIFPYLNNWALIASPIFLNSNA